MRFHQITLSPGCRVSLTGAPSSTRATFPRHVPHVPRKTKLLPCTAPVKSVMMVMSPQWGHQTFCKTRSWKCGEMASQSSCAGGVNEGCIRVATFGMMCCVVCLHHEPYHRSGHEHG